MNMFLVRHLHGVDGEDNDIFESKIIGIFSSEEKAKDAVNLLKIKPGFIGFPDDFIIDDYTVDEIEWDQGFAEGWPKGINGLA